MYESKEEENKTIWNNQPTNQADKEDIIAPFATWWGGVGLESLWEINILKQIQFKGSKKSKATENQTCRIPTENCGETFLLSFQVMHSF